MTIVNLPQFDRLVLHGEPWESYARLLKLFAGRHHVRITYDRGLLEIMILSPIHEAFKYFFMRLHAALTEELGIAIAGYGSMTFKRRGRQRGLEPDECYWIQNEQLVRSLTQYDPRRDPPPDLVVEIDIESSSANRMGIYRSMKVAEVWRFDGTTLQFHILGPKGYTVEAGSRAFPGLKSTDLTPFLAQRGQIEMNALIRQFRAWVQGRIAANWQ